jgi:hypothetical protein
MEAQVPDGLAEDAAVCIHWSSMALAASKRLATGRST